MKEIKRSYIITWKSISLVAAVGIILVLLGFATDLNAQFEIVLLLFIVVICLAVYFDNKYSTKKSFTE